jgi:hypothetical protein
MNRWKAVCAILWRAGRTKPLSPGTPGIEDKSSHQVAFSDDGGVTFPTVRKIDVANGEAQPLERPAIALMSTDHALVVWITHENGKYHLVDAQVDNATPDVRRIDISQGSSGCIGYPRIRC